MSAASQARVQQVRSRRTLAGIALVVLSTAFFASMDTVSKVVVAAGVPILMGVWFRYAVQALVTTAFILPTQGRAVLLTRRPLQQVVRGLLLLGSTGFLFASLIYLPVGELTAILLTAPLVITLVAAVALRERVSPLRWLLVAGGFAGTLLIIRPGSHGSLLAPAMLLPLGNVACNTAFQILTSRMARTENPLTMHLYTGWVAALGASLALPVAWQAVPFGPVWGAMLVTGLLGAAGHFLLILAYQRAPAMTLTPYLYGQIAFAMLGGWLLFSHVPDGWAVAGIALIAVCGAGGAWLATHESRAVREALQALERPPQASGGGR